MEINFTWVTPSIIIVVVIDFAAHKEIMVWDEDKAVFRPWQTDKDLMPERDI